MPCKTKEIAADRFVMETLAVSVEQGAVVSKANSYIAIIDMGKGARCNVPQMLLDVVKSLE